MKSSIKLNSKTLFYDLAFMLIAYVCLYNYFKSLNIFKWAPALPIAMLFINIIIIYFFPVNVTRTKEVYSNKKALVPFFIIYIIADLITIGLNKAFTLNNNSTINEFNILFIYCIKITLTLTLFIIYLFKIRLRDFNWKVSISSLILIIVAFIVYYLTYNISSLVKGTLNINTLFSIKYLKNIITQSLYPGIFEEVLYRGLLISGLLGLGLSKEKTNFIQAIIFGASHLFAWGTPSWTFLLGTMSQAVIGYLFGKIYLKTNSLTPCILLHGLIDAIRAIV